MSKISLDDAKNLVRKLVKEKEFPESEAALYQKLLWAFVELGEATDAFKKGENWEVIAEELIDTIFYILDFLGLVEITQNIELDLDKIFINKWKKNMERPNYYGLRKDITHSEGSLPHSLEKITLEITKKCNNKCQHCSAYIPGEKSEKIIEFKQIKKITDEFTELNGKEINISGGEPLLHPEIFEIISYIKNKGLKLNLFTCGVLNGEEQIKEIINNISKHEIDEIMTTVHSSYAEMHDEISDKTGSFEQTIDFIKKLIEAKQNIGVHFVPMQVNSDEVEEVAEFLVNLDVPSLEILRFIPQGRGRENKDWLILSRDIFANLINEVMKLIKRNDIKVTPGHPGDFRFLIDNTIKPKPCTAGKLQCMIKVNGDVIPCPAFGDLNDWIAGNVFETNLTDIWQNSPEFFKLREFDFRRLQGTCRGCEYIHICQGRCTAERIRENGDLHKGPDPGCPKEYLV